jgi:TM2 domain-containing membrane protein YozV
MDKKIIAAIMSFLIPGLGQFYGGHKVRGVLVFLGAIFSINISSVLSIPIYAIIQFIVAWDAYRVAPKVDVYIMFWQKMGLIGMGFLLLTMGVIKSENELAPIMAIFFLIAAMICLSMMHGGQRDSTATLRVHDAIVKMGFSPAETREIANDVVSILKAGGGSYHTNAEGPLSKMSDAIVSGWSGWADFTPGDLSSAISTVLEIRYRRQKPPLT